MSNAAHYKKKAGNTIIVLYPKLIHVTSLAHKLHRVAEQVCVHYPKIDKLVSSVNQNFFKAPSQILLFKTMNPGISLPPELILTHWESLIEAMSYYTKYFRQIVM